MLLLAVVMGSATDDTAATFSYAIAFGTLAIAMVLTLAYRRTQDALNPITLVMAMFLLDFPLHAFVAVDAPGTLSRLGHDRHAYLEWWWWWWWRGPARWRSTLGFGARLRPVSCVASRRFASRSTTRIRPLRSS
ncbi:MAG: hypothetical protein ACI9MR_001558 [Myxococcota bacterium]